MKEGSNGYGTWTDGIHYVTTGSKNHPGRSMSTLNLHTHTHWKYTKMISIKGIQIENNFSKEERSKIRDKKVLAIAHI